MASSLSFSDVFRVMNTIYNPDNDVNLVGGILDGLSTFNAADSFNSTVNKGMKGRSG